MKGKLVHSKTRSMVVNAFSATNTRDYPESALYMIGAIGEAKKPDAKVAADTQAKDAGKEKTKPETQTKAAA